MPQDGQREAWEGCGGEDAVIATGARYFLRRVEATSMRAPVGSRPQKVGNLLVIAGCVNCKEREGLLSSPGPLLVGSGRAEERMI